MTINWGLNIMFFYYSQERNTGYKDNKMTFFLQFFLFREESFCNFYYFCTRLLITYFSLNKCYEL